MKDICLIVVCGYMHSGTTLLYDIVSKHPDVLKSRKESKILEFESVLQRDYEACLNKLEFLSKAARCEALSPPRGGLTGCVSKDFFAYLETCAFERGVKFAVEASPNSFLFASRLDDMLQEKRFVFLFRDPRDILWSIKKRYLKNRAATFEDGRANFRQRASFFYSPFLHSLSIRRTYSKIKRAHARYADESLLIDYYDLVSNYTQTVKRISEVVGLPVLGFPSESDLAIRNVSGHSRPFFPKTIWLGNLLPNSTRSRSCPEPPAPAAPLASGES